MCPVYIVFVFICAKLYVAHSCIYMYVYICVCIYIYMYIYIYIYIYILLSQTIFNVFLEGGENQKI